MIQLHKFNSTDLAKFILISHHTKWMSLILWSSFFGLTIKFSTSSLLSYLVYERVVVIVIILYIATEAHFTVQNIIDANQNFLF